MSAYNSESALARLLRPHYARGDDEARALLREAFTLTGDLQITGTTLPVRLDPASAPRRSNALAALCVDLTDTATRYPGTDLTLAYSIKGHGANHGRGSLLIRHPGDPTARGSPFSYDEPATERRKPCLVQVGAASARARRAIGQRDLSAR